MAEGIHSHSEGNTTQHLGPPSTSGSRWRAEAASPAMTRELCRFVISLTVFYYTGTDMAEVPVETRTVCDDESDGQEGGKERRRRERRTREQKETQEPQDTKHSLLASDVLQSCTAVTITSRKSLGSLVNSGFQEFIGPGWLT